MLKYQQQLEDILKREGFNFLVGRNRNFLCALEKAKKVSSFDFPVLITGEHGTGKGVLAKAIHTASPYREKPFIKVNCAAVPDTLIESEFFGYEAGSFTGAKREGKKGFFELANGGTLFLDEIGDLSYIAQAKLLTVLQEQEFMKIGAQKSTKVNVRIISATNKKIEILLGKKLIREDLFYRLNAIHIHLPSLRERKEDIKILAQRYLFLLCNRTRTKKRFSTECIKLLEDYDWPGNIRELINVIEYAIVMSDNIEIKPKDLPEYIVKLTNSRSLHGQRCCRREEGLEDRKSEMVIYEQLLERFKGRTWKDMINQIEKSLLVCLLEKTKNRSSIIKTYRISRTQFYLKLKKFSIKF